MKANQLKPSEKLADIVIDGVPPIVTKEARPKYKYVNNERTSEIEGYTTDLVLTNQNYEKAVCVTPNMPRVFLGGEITEPIQVEFVNPVAEITYNNEIKFTADDIILNDEVVL